MWRPKVVLGGVGLIHVSGWWVISQAKDREIAPSVAEKRREREERENRQGRSLVFPSSTRENREGQYKVNLLFIFDLSLIQPVLIHE